MGNIVRSALDLVRGLWGAILLAIAANDDPLRAGKAVGMIDENTNWLLGEQAMRAIFLAAVFIWIFVWYHRKRMSLEVATPAVEIIDLVARTIKGEQYWCLLVEGLDPKEQLDGCLATIDSGIDENGREKLSLMPLGTERQFAEDRPRGRFKMDPGLKKCVVLFKHHNKVIAVYRLWTVDGKGHKMALSGDEKCRIDVQITGPRGGPAKASVWFAADRYWLERNGNIIREYKTEPEGEINEET